MSEPQDRTAAVVARRCAAIALDRSIVNDPAQAMSREWLVTNGLGGFASGTVAGAVTRRYHGLLVAALDPPLGRTLLVAKLEEVVTYQGGRTGLATNLWADGTVAPRGYESLDRFELQGTTPVWRFAVGDALLEKRIWMCPGRNATVVRYEVLRASARVGLELRALVDHRDYHAVTREGDRTLSVDAVSGGIRVSPPSGAPFYLRADRGTVAPEHQWYRGFRLSAERARGLGDLDDHLHAATFSAELAPGEALTWLAATEEALDPAAIDPGEVPAREAALLSSAARGWPAVRPAAVDVLVRAADAFVVGRRVGAEAGHSVIAGYPWFGDWGRDTMIALPGLTLATGRPEVAASLLRTFVRFLDRGMLPNRFPDDGEDPEYNTVDATLWFVEAVRRTFGHTGDRALVEALFPSLASIVDHHVRGTRYGIRVDPVDGLLRAGEPGEALTWMDARIDGVPVTPRIGKPVEINALWLQALRTVAELAPIAGQSGDRFSDLADRATASFPRFFSRAHGWCFDVLDGPGGDDASLRPNQLLAVSLPHSGLAADQQRAVVQVCVSRLLTPHGLRTLDREDRRYVPRYAGGPARRDSAYHQGTVWAWWIGPFVDAVLRVTGDRVLAASYLEPLFDQVTGHGVGSLSEISDAEAPFRPGGCPAQAWSVAEVLRAWDAVGS